MLETVFVGVAVAGSVLYWVGRIFPSFKKRLRRFFGGRGQDVSITEDPATQKKCGSCPGCRGGNCH